MFGTLGFSELIIIAVIVLIIFGAGRLPQIGEGLGKALKGFKKEVHEAPPPLDPNAAVADPNSAQAATAQQQPPPSIEEAQVVSRPQAAQAQAASSPTAPYQPGPELTPGTTAALMASAGPQKYEPKKSQGAPPSTPTTTAAAQAKPLTMEERQAQVATTRAAYPPVPAAAQGKAPPKRPSAVVNKDAVARVQAQQAALKAKATASQPSPAQDMQGLGESLGDALRTFRQATADVRNAIDPEMRTIRAEVDAAQKELEQSLEAAKQMPAGQDDPPKTA